MNSENIPWNDMPEWAEIYIRDNYPYPSKDFSGWYQSQHGGYYSIETKVWITCESIDGGYASVYYPPNYFPVGVESEVTDAIRIAHIPLASKYPYGSELHFHGDDGVQTGTVVGWKENIIVLGVGDNYKGISEHQVATEEELIFHDFLQYGLSIVDDEYFRLNHEQRVQLLYALHARGMRFVTE